MSWINQIANGISTVFKNTRPSLKFIPALFLICEVKNRPGLSAIALASSIIQRLPEAGIYTGLNPDGTPNKFLKFIVVLIEEIIKELKDNAKISSVIESQKINSLGVGANAGGPVTVSSYNTLPLVIYGLLE